MTYQVPVCPVKKVLLPASLGYRHLLNLVVFPSEAKVIRGWLLSNSNYLRFNQFRVYCMPDFDVLLDLIAHSQIPSQEQVASL